MPTPRSKISVSLPPVHDASVLPACLLEVPSNPRTLWTDQSRVKPYSYSLTIQQIRSLNSAESCGYYDPQWPLPWHTTEPSCYPNRLCLDLRLTEGSEDRSSHILHYTSSKAYVPEKICPKKRFDTYTFSRYFPNKCSRILRSRLSRLIFSEYCSFSQHS